MRKALPPLVSSARLMISFIFPSLDMLHLLTPYNVKDLRLSGHVIYVGKSSMEVAVRMESLEQGKPVQTMMLGERPDHTPFAATGDLSLCRPIHHGLS